MNYSDSFRFLVSESDVFNLFSMNFLQVFDKEFTVAPLLENWLVFGIDFCRGASSLTVVSSLEIIVSFRYELLALEAIAHFGLSWEYWVAARTLEWIAKWLASSMFV